MSGEWKGPVADRMPTTEEKAQEFDKMMDECRFGTWPYDICGVMWGRYNKYRSVYGYDKPGEDAGFPTYVGGG